MKGKKKWFSGNRKLMASEGDCIFVKKGAHSIYQYFDDEFCSLFMFVSDHFFKETVKDQQVNLLNDLKSVFERYNRADNGTAIVENIYLQTIVWV